MTPAPAPFTPTIEYEGSLAAEVDRMIYSPMETAAYGSELVQDIQANQHRALKFPVTGMQFYVSAVMPWQTCVIVAQTSQYKTGTLNFWENYAAGQLVEQNRDDEAILVVSLEETIEAMAFREFARYGQESAGDLEHGVVKDWNGLLIAATKAAGVPVYRIGISKKRRDMLSKMYLSNIERAIERLASGKITGQPVKFGGIFLDYLQALPLDPEIKRGKIEMQRRLQVMEDVYRLQDWPIKFDAPVVYAAQAKAALGSADSKWRLPTFDDGEETNALAQRPDRILTQWMPKQTSPIGTIIKHGNTEFLVEENRLVFKVAKQRGNLPAGRIFGAYIDFARNSIEFDPNFGTGKVVAGNGHKRPGDDVDPADVF
jgi:hypothetical protein